MVKTAWIEYQVKCGHEGCTNRDVVEWSIGGYDPQPVFFFCPEHAAEFGFCIWCGNFIGGTEDIFLTGQVGLCFECFYQMEEESREFYDEYEDDYDD